MIPAASAESNLFFILTPLGLSLLRRIEQRLIRQSARQILNIGCSWGDQPALHDADENNIVGRIDPTPRSGDAIPQEGPLAGRAAEFQRVLEYGEIIAKAQARLHLIQADAKLPRILHLVRNV